MTGSPEDLALALKEQLTGKHGSIAQAAGDLGIPYERLKQSLRRSRFSAADAQLLIEDVMPGVTLDDLKRDYGFEPARAYSGGAATAPQSADGDPFSEALQPLYSSLPILKKEAKGGVLNPVVSDIYAAWQTEMSMILFCDGSIDPVEWDANYKEARTNLNDALCKGGIIVYVASNYDDSSGTSSSRDRIDQKFDSFWSRLREEHPNPAPELTGFVALLRAPRCSFCIPFQKPSLFTRRENGNTSIRAFTTIDIPETVDGESYTGVICIPLTRQVAKGMVEYLDLLTMDMQTSSDGRGICRVKSYPEHDDAEIISRIRGII